MKTRMELAYTRLNPPDAQFFLNKPHVDFASLITTWQGVLGVVVFYPALL